MVPTYGYLAVKSALTLRSPLLSLLARSNAPNSLHSLPFSLLFPSIRVPPSLPFRVHLGGLSPGMRVQGN